MAVTRIEAEPSTLVVDLDHAALIIIDMQRDFLEPGGFGASLGNDVNLRDVEGRSALLLGKAKDNNGSAALGPFIRLFDDGFGLGSSRACNASLTKVPAPTRASRRPSEISRSTASITVVRETPISWARVRVAGKRSPGVKAPVSNRSRKAM